VVVSPTVTTVYTVTGTSGSCTDTKTISITVNNGPTVTVVSSPTVLCSASGSSATLTASGALSYTWNPSAVISSSLVITPTVTSNYSVTGTNALGCTSTTTISFSVTPTPTLIAGSSSTAICAGSSVTLNAVGAASYSWNPGALTGGTVTVTPAVNTTYTVTGSNGNCTTTTTIAIVVNANPTLTTSSSPTVICSGSSSTLSANGAVTYTWNPGALTGQTVNVTPGSTTNYTVTGTNASGCISSAVTSVSVNITPTLIPVASPTAICIGGTSTISSSGATTYTWNPGNLTGSSITVSPIINTTYTVVGSSANCFDTKTITLIVNPLPIVNATSNPTAICVGNSATLTGSGASTYSWMPGSLAGTNVIVSPLVNTTYTVTGTNNNGCVNTKTVSVVVNANPTLTAVSNPTSICSASGASATLTAGGAITYTWVPGNLIGTNVTVTPTATTVYSVTGTNASGCTSTKTVSILVSPTPTLTIVSSPTAICRGGSATLTANGATNYTWLPGGSTATSIVVSPTVNTTYTLLGNSGNCSASKTFTLVVRPLPNINILTLPPVICKGASTTLLANGANSYTWNPGSLTGNSVVVSPSVTTIFTVTGANLFGCTRTATTNIVVNPTPTISTIPSSTLLCSGAGATLTSTGALTYVYNPGAQTGSAVVVSPAVNTTYTVTGVNSFGCTDTKTVSIAVGSNPTITALSSATLACNNTSISLSATGATNYTWMPVGLTGGSVVTTATNSANTYTVIGESGGCFGVATLSVLVIDCNNTIFGITKAAGKPVLVNNSFYDVTFTITAVNTSSLNLTNVSLNEDLNAAFPFPSAYSIVNQPIITSHNSSLTINPLFDGGSQISLTAPGSSTLLANKRDTVVFTVRIDPRGYFGPFKNSVIGFADILNSITLSDSSNNGFSWDPDGDGDPTNNDTVTVINLPLIDLFIPEGFTPDGDGKNDFFFIKGLNGRPVKLTIFNRWGNKVYEKSDYDNSWNGYVNTTAITLGSNKVPAATYYYIIEFLDGDKESKTGFVVVQY
jgi:gliding motility-associated-like protein